MLSLENHRRSYSWSTAKEYDSHHTRERTYWKLFGEGKHQRTYSYVSSHHRVCSHIVSIPTASEATKFSDNLQIYLKLKC